MATHGSNEYITVVLDAHEPGKHGVHRFQIEKGNPVLVYQDTSQKVDSGSPQTLINFAQWIIDNYEFDHCCIILWDHGTSSSLDPHISRSMEASELLNFNITTQLLEQNLTQGFPEFIVNKRQRPIHRGCCFDDTYRSYLNNQDLNFAFREIKNGPFRGRMWDIVGFDACLMADLSTASLLKNYAHYLVASEETEPGTGWRYDLVLAPFGERALTPIEFAQHIVHSYGQAYCLFINDYTQSAIDLHYIHALEKNLREIALLLSECLRNQKDRFVKDALQISFNRRVCTSFYEQSLKDLGHLCSNVLKNVDMFQFTNENLGIVLKNTLKEKLHDGIELIKNSVVANSTGKTFQQAMGISIYCPETRIHSSFPKTSFAMNEGNEWYTFIKQFLIP